MNVILPVAGKSSRFPNLRPKWLLTNPSGNLMIVDSILGLDITSVDCFYIIYLKEHEDKYSFRFGLNENLKKYGLDSKVTYIELANETANQVATVRLGLEQIQKDISFLIKDCDNFFRCDWPKHTQQNFVSFCNLKNIKSSDVASKSFVDINEMGLIANIVEKKIISDKFCCGGYFFESSHQFLQYSNLASENLYVSDVVFNMLLHGKTFIGVECFDYQDWGTANEWKKYKNTFKTLFVDLDGTLVENSAAYIAPYIGQTSQLPKNVSVLKKLIATKRVEVIITTSRPEEYRAITEAQLKDLGIEYRHLLMGLQHSQRVIINDYGQSNPYKSCDAINLERNKDNLEQYLAEWKED